MMCAGIFYVFYTMRREAVKELTASTAKVKNCPGSRSKSPVQFFLSDQRQSERSTTI